MGTEKFRAWAEIDLDALLANHRAVKGRLGKREKICAVIKADAYGHGAIRVAKLLEEETDFFAVAMAEEAYELRRAGVEKPILILGIVPEAHIAGLIEKDVRLTVATLNGAKAIARAARGVGKKAKIHIALDTGMGRIGFLPDIRSAAKIAEIASYPSVEIEGIFSHFATADGEEDVFAAEQQARFDGFLEKLKELNVKPKIVHLYNSAGICRFGGGYAMAREGLVLYGLPPSEEIAGELPAGVRPAMTVKARIVQIKTVPKGTPVSYGSTFVTEKKTKIATVSMGYGDGLPRGLSNCGDLLVHGRRAPILGRVCMDQLMIDVSAIDGVGEGDEAVVFGFDGKEELSCAEQAKKCGTISYELLCNVNRRVPRVYIKDGAIESVADLLAEK